MFQIKRATAIMPAVEALWQEGAANDKAFVLWNNYSSIKKNFLSKLISLIIYLEGYSINSFDVLIHTKISKYREFCRSKWGSSLKTLSNFNNRINNRPLL